MPSARTLTNARRVFADVNAVLDYVAKRGEHFLPMAKVLTLNRYGHLTIGVAASTFPFAYHQLTERLGFPSPIANRILGGFAGEVSILPVDGAVLSDAFANPIDDLEDAVQYACASSFGAQLILTRDVTGFERGTIPAAAPAEVLGQGS